MRANPSSCTACVPSSSPTCAVVVVSPRGGLERTYEGIDRLLQGQLGNPAFVDAFEPVPLSREVEERFTALEQKSMDIEGLYGLYRRMDEVVTNYGGSVVRLHGDRVCSVFDDASAAVFAAAALGALPSPPLVLGLPAALHRRPAGAVSLNERLDYFGRSVLEVIALVARAHAGELLVADAIAGHHGVVALKQGEVVTSRSIVDDVGYRLCLSARSKR